MLEGSGIRTLMHSTETLCGVTFRVASVSRDLTHSNIMLYKIGFSALLRSLCLRHNQSNERLPEDCVSKPIDVTSCALLLFMLTLAHFCCDIPLNNSTQARRWPLCQLFLLFNLIRAQDSPDASENPTVLEKKTHSLQGIFSCFPPRLRQFVENIHKEGTHLSLVCPFRSVSLPLPSWLSM